MNRETYVTLIDSYNELKEQAFPELHKGEDYSWNGGYDKNVKSTDFSKAFDKFQAQGYQIYREMRHQRVVACNIDNVYSSETLSNDKADKPKIQVIKE